MPVYLFLRQSSFTMTKAKQSKQSTKHGGECNKTSLSCYSSIYLFSFLLVFTSALEQSREERPRNLNASLSALSLQIYPYICTGKGDPICTFDLGITSYVLQ